MKQIIISKYGPPSVLQVQERRNPTPRKNQVLIRNYFSGINFSEKEYEQFLDGKDVVFSNLKNDGVRLFSLDGILAEKISFEEWCK